MNTNRRVSPAAGDRRPWAAGFGVELSREIGFVIIVLFMAPATGCMATFASLASEQTFPLIDRPSLYVAVSSEMRQLNNAEQQVPILFSPDYSNDVINALNACDCYGKLAREPGASDLEVFVRVRRVVYNRSALLNLATAMLIPAVEDRHITVRVRVKDAESGDEAEAQRDHGFRVWYQLFLIPVYPFKSPAAFEMRLFPQLIRETVAQAIARLRRAPMGQERPAAGAAGRAVIQGVKTLASGSVSRAPVVSARDAADP